MTMKASAAARDQAPGPHPWCRRAVDDHFRGRCPPSRERAMRVHLVACADCRDHYQRHLRLAAVDQGGALPARERLGRGLGLQPSRAGTRTASLRLLLAVVPVAAALALLPLISARRPPAPEGGLGARGASGARLASQLLVYDVAEGGPVRQVTSEVDADGRLAFAYANLAHKRRLLVFAVDERRRVYWYHPAWTDARENPVAVDIAGDEAIHEIPEAVMHRFEGQRLQLFGAFVDDALSVRDVESRVARAAAGAGGRLELALPGAEIARLDLKLTRGR